MIAAPDPSCVDPLPELGEGERILAIGEPDAPTFIRIADLDGHLEQHTPNRARRADTYAA